MASLLLTTFAVALLLVACVVPRPGGAISVDEMENQHGQVQPRPRCEDRYCGKQTSRGDCVQDLWCLSNGGWPRG